MNRLGFVFGYGTKMGHFPLLLKTPHGMRASKIPPADSQKEETLECVCVSVATKKNISKFSQTLWPLAIFAIRLDVYEVSSFCPKMAKNGKTGNTEMLEHLNVKRVAVS